MRQHALRTIAIASASVKPQSKVMWEYRPLSYLIRDATCHRACASLVYSLCSVPCYRSAYSPSNLSQHNTAQHVDKITPSAFIKQHLTRTTHTSLSPFPV